MHTHTSIIICYLDVYGHRAIRSITHPTWPLQSPHHYGPVSTSAVNEDGQRIADVSHVPDIYYHTVVWLNSTSRPSNIYFYWRDSGGPLENTHVAADALDAILRNLKTTATHGPGT